MFKKLSRLIRSKNEAGNVLLTVLVVFAVGAILIVPVISLMVGGLESGQTVEEDMGELYAADSGVEYAMFYIMNNLDLLPTTESPTLVIPFNNTVNNVTVDVRCEYIEDNKFLIVAETSDTDTGADLLNINSFIELKQDGEGGVSTIFNNAITTLGGGVTASGAAVITGSVFSNGNINLSGSANIGGDVYAENNIGLGPATSIDGDAYTQGTINRPGNVTGSANAGAENQDVDPLSDEVINGVIEEIIEASDFTPVAAGPVTHTGDTTFQPWWPTPSDTISDAVHVSGNMTVNGATNLTFQSSVHVDGNLTINASGKTIIFNGPVVVNGNITLQNGNIIFNNSVYAGGSLSLIGSANAVFNDDCKVENDLTLGSSGDVSFGGTIYVGDEFSSNGDRKIEISSDVYVGGDLTMNGSSAIEGGHTFVVMGDVELCGATKLADEDIPFLLVPTGDVDLNGSSYISAVVYAPEADVAYGGAITLYGSLVCNSISMSGSAHIEYAEGVIDNPYIIGGGDPEISGIAVLSWTIN